MSRPAPLPSGTAVPSGFVQAAAPLLRWLLGPNRATRSLTLSVVLITLVYLACCWAAWHAAHVGIMAAWAAPTLTGVTVPCNLIFLILVRSGWSRRLQDPRMMMAQNVLALVAIVFSYLAVAPADRGAVFVLLPLVIVFGMYAHVPRHALIIGVTVIAVLSAVVLLLTHVDPEYYPFERELLRLELLLGVLPVLLFAALQTAHWRNRLRHQRAELQEALSRVQHLVTRDALTGLFNRRHMQERLDGETARLSRYGDQFTLALIDLDHFKAINDQHGHKVGDQVLAAFSQAALEALRDSDVLGRWGGEEFLVIFPNCTPAQAVRPLQRLQADLRVRLLSSAVPGLRVTFSAGLCRHESGETIAATLERADAALYEAKRAGRDRVCLGSPGDLPSMFDAIHEGPEAGWPLSTPRC